MSDAAVRKLRQIEPLLARAEALSHALPPWAHRLAARHVARIAPPPPPCAVRAAIQTSMERRS